MGEYYGRKIQNREINEKTGMPWVIEDVPKLWKKSTIAWLESHPMSLEVTE